MTTRIAQENHYWLIQIFQKGMDTQPTLKYQLQTYELSEGMIHVLDPKTNLTKSFPTNICTIDEVKE
jgi:hypothetical protein